MPTSASSATHSVIARDHLLAHGLIRRLRSPAAVSSSGLTLSCCCFPLTLSLVGSTFGQPDRVPIAIESVVSYASNEEFKLLKLLVWQASARCPSCFFRRHKLNLFQVAVLALCKQKRLCQCSSTPFPIQATECCKICCRLQPCRQEARRSRDLLQAALLVCCQRGDVVASGWLSS